MGVAKKRTPRAVERAAANRERNETRATTNVHRLDGRTVSGERPSKTLRRLERARRFAEVPEGGDAA